MSAIVGEVMNPELFSVRPDEAAERVLGYILSLEITGVPVVDEGGRPRGLASLRDLVGVKKGVPIADRMTRPPVTVADKAPIREAARLLAETGLHRLIVVDAQGRAVGMVSAVDVICGLTGRPARHPSAFAHFDTETGLVWTDWTPLAMERIEAAPSGPGVLMLQHSVPDEPDRLVWAEATGSLRSRLIDLLSEPQSRTPQLARWLAKGSLRFRAASVPKTKLRRKVASQLLAAAEHHLAPMH